MYYVIVANRDTKEVVARYSFDSVDLAKIGRIDIMTEWVAMCRHRVIVSAIMAG